MARRLEEGSTAEVAELVRGLGRARLASWVETHGGRLLTRRSRALWTRWLGVEAVPRPLASACWPQA